jgi:hypothetical protein
VQPVHGRPHDPPMSLACRGPKVCDTTTTFCVNKSISTWTKPNPNLYKCKRGQSRTLSIFEQSRIHECIYDEVCVFISTRAHDYSKLSTSEKGKKAELPSLPLHIENTLGEIVTRIPKGAFKKASHNPNARATQNYSVVEDLSQTPCAMSSLEVRQSCPSRGNIF